MWSTNILLPLGIILLLGIISYANTCNVSRQLDDDAVVLIARNHGNDLFNIQAFIHKPRWFTDVTFALNRYLYGEQVTGFHLFNLAIHLSAAVICYLFIRQAIEALRQTWQIQENDVFLQQFVPFTTALFFVCHPIQTQAVTYISQRYTSLTALLYLGSLLSYVKARLSPADASNKWHISVWGGIGVVLALLAMKSKEIAFTLPLMAAVLEALLFRGKWLKNAVFISIGIALLLVIPCQLLFTHSHGSVGNPVGNLLAVATETDAISRTDYLLTQLRVVATYLRLLIMPINQNLDYDYPLYHSLFEPSVMASLLLHMVMAGLAAALFIRSRKLLGCGCHSTGMAMRLASLGIIWFYLALSVESSFIPISDVIFEHRVYLPSTGFFMAVAAALSMCRHCYRNYLLVSVVLLSFALAAGSVARNRIWADETALWQDVLKKSPRKARARYSVGVLYFKKYLPEKAIPYLVGALELDGNRLKYWDSLNDTIAITGKFKGRYADGLQYHATTDIINPAYIKQWWAVNFNNLGLAYEHMGNLYHARKYFLKAAEVNPALDLAWYNLALVAAWQNDTTAVSMSLQRLRDLNSLLTQGAAKAVAEAAASRDKQ